VTVRLDTMLKTVKFPTGISNLATCLADVDGDALTHDDSTDDVGGYSSAKRSMR